MPYFGPEPMVTFINDSGGRVVVRVQRSRHIQKLVTKPAARGFDTACGRAALRVYPSRKWGNARTTGPSRPAAFLCGFCCMVAAKYPALKQTSLPSRGRTRGHLLKPAMAARLRPFFSPEIFFPIAWRMPAMIRRGPHFSWR